MVNLGANNAGVTVNIVGVSKTGFKIGKRIFDGDQVRAVSNISPYLLATPNIFIETEPSPLAELPL